MDESESRHLPEDITTVLDDLQLRVEAICRSQGAHAYTADVVQEVMIKLWKAWHRVRVLDEGGFRRYLWRMTINEIADQATKASARGRLEVTDPASLADAVSSREREDGTDLAMQDLLAMIADPRQREACRLYYVEGLTEEEIAGKSGVSTASVSRLLGRAKQALRKRLEAEAP